MQTCVSLNASFGHIPITTMPAVNREEWKSLLQQTIGKKKYCG